MKLDEDQRWLRCTSRPGLEKPIGRVRLVDLFCGCGGMTLGIAEAARRSQWVTEIALAVDMSPVAAAVYKRNFTAARVIAGDVSDLLPGKPLKPLTKCEKKLRTLTEGTTILLGGPPCVGHSDLNNHTRRSDPQNALYLRMARAAEVIQPRCVIIENVPAVRRDSNGVVDVTSRLLEKLGYQVAGVVLDCSKLGVPQRRQRYILLAIRDSSIDAVELLDRVATKPTRDVEWAIRDLVTTKSDALLDKPSKASRTNAERIAYLFKKRRYDLPNEERPDCHQDEHSYKSMYGRLRWKLPAQTITTGFTSMGQGRYVHPSRRRTLTPHEAARLQTLPDWLDWGDARRTALSMMIGNAVPPLMMMSLGEAILPVLADAE